MLLFSLSALLATSMPDSAGHWPQAASIQAVGLTFHPGGGTQPDLYPRRLDDGGWWVVQLGAAASYDVEPWTYFGIRAKTAWYRDCADKPQMFFHLGVRGWIHKGENWSVHGGFGPTLVMRKDWQNLPGYAPNGFFGDDTWRGWQHRFLWYGGEFDLMRRLDDRTQLAISMVPGFPWAITTMIGVRRSW